MFSAIYRCLCIPMGIYGFLGVYGHLWVSWVSMGIILMVNIKNIAYFLIQDPRKTSEVTHVLQKIAYAPRARGTLSTRAFSLLVNKVSFLSLGA